MKRKRLTSSAPAIDISNKKAKSKNYSLDEKKLTQKKNKPFIELCTKLAEQQKFIKKNKNDLIEYINEINSTPEKVIIQLIKDEIENTQVLKVAHYLKLKPEKIKEHDQSFLISYLKGMAFTPSAMIKKSMTVADKSKDLKKLTQLFYSHLHEKNKTRESKDDTPWADRRFDALSRLLALNSQCAAACFTGEKIIIAFNELHEQSQHLAGAKELEAHAQQVMLYLASYARSNNKLTEEIKNNRLEILAKICTVKLKLTDKDNIKRIKRIINNLDLYRGNTKADIFNMVNPQEINTIAQCRRDLLKLEIALKHDFDKSFDNSLIQAFVKNEYYITACGEQSNKYHAEMRIRDQLIKISQKKSSSIRNQIYIGLSKLSCAHCHLVFTNNDRAPCYFICNDKKVFIYTRGHHGLSHEWQTSASILDNQVILENFLGENAQKLFNNLSEIDQKLFFEIIIPKIGLLTNKELKILQINCASHSTKSISGNYDANISDSDPESSDLNRENVDPNVSITVAELNSNKDNNLKNFSPIKKTCLGLFAGVAENHNYNEGTSYTTLKFNF